MDSHMFDGLITGLVVVGIVIGAGLVGLAWAVYAWVLPHIHISISIR